MSHKILCIGLSCLDIVQHCKEYPLEDSDQRSLTCQIQRGGNASNNCTVLSLLGSTCEYLGVITRNLFGEFIQKDFDKYNIETSACEFYTEFECPLTTIIINAQNGSRTIVHSNKGLPELSSDCFEKLDWKKYSWIHFEGRNVSEVSKMISHVNEMKKTLQNSITVSVELEMKKELLPLASEADIIFIGKDFSKQYNWDGMETTIKEMRKYVKQSAIIISIWGEEGAMASSPEGIFSAPAYPPERVVDTLGAGDTFCAGFIHSMSRGKSLNESLHFGCQIAGYKVGTIGYDQIKYFVP